MVRSKAPVSEVFIHIAKVHQPVRFKCRHGNKEGAERRQIQPPVALAVRNPLQCNHDHERGKHRHANCLGGNCRPGHKEGTQLIAPAYRPVQRTQPMGQEKKGGQLKGKGRNFPVSAESESKNNRYAQ